MRCYKSKVKIHFFWGEEGLFVFYFDKNKTFFPASFLFNILIHTDAFFFQDKCWFELYAEG